MRTLAILFFIFFLASGSPGQQNIPVLKERKCNPAVSSSKTVQFKITILRCMLPESNAAILFTGKDSFQEHLNKGKLSDCAIDIESLNFKKYDIILFNIETSYPKAVTENDFKVTEGEEGYTINLNVVIKKQENSILHIIGGYILIPKSKKNVLNFTVYESAEKCF